MSKLRLTEREVKGLSKVSIVTEAEMQPIETSGLWERKERPGVGGEREK